MFLWTDNAIRTMEPSIDFSLLRHLNLNHLVSFLAVAEWQSFRVSAQRLHISQAALSVQIRQLEETLRVPVFHRTTRSVTLTEEGGRLLRVARLLAQEVTSVASDFREEAALRRGVATLATTPSIAARLIPPVLHALTESHPGIKIQLLVKDSSNAIAATVQQNEADIGLVNFTEQLKDLQVTRLLEDKFVAVVPASIKKLASLKSVTLRQLSEFPLLLQSRGSTMRELLDVHFRELGLSVNVRQEVLHAEVLAALVGHGVGVAILPLGSLATLKLEGAKVIRLRDVRSRFVGLITSPRRSLSPAAALLCKFIENASRQLSSAELHQPERCASH